jgi:hypothetical protein
MKKGLLILVATFTTIGLYAAHAQFRDPLETARQIVQNPTQPPSQLLPVQPPKQLPPPPTQPPHISASDKGIVVDQPGLGTITQPLDPTKPLANVESKTGNQAIDKAVNDANNNIQHAQKQLGDLARDGAMLPIKAAQEALKIVGDAAKKAIEDIVAAAKVALDNNIQALWKDYKWYVYEAGAALFVILMAPALVAAWIVRRIGRKREKKLYETLEKAQDALEDAKTVIRAYAQQTGVKLAA